MVVFLAALPIWVAYAYASSIKRQHSLNQVFVPRWWHRLFEGHLLRVPVLLVVSLWFGVEVLTLPTRPSEVREVVEREGIGKLLCRVGTIKPLEILDGDFEASVQQHAASIADRTDVVFDEMRARVPVFLDWYYSLTADYLRTGHVLIGDGSDYLNKQLLERLAPSGAADSIESVYGDLTRNLLDYNAKRLAILSLCGPEEVTSDHDQIKIIAQYDPSKGLSAITRLNELLAGGTSFELRAGGSTLVAVAAGTVIAKVGVSSSFKLAAKVLAKVAGKKATTVLGGVLAGAGIGGAAGSTVPGAGTGVGAVVGGIVGGGAIMVGVDFMALKLDEEINRAEFEAELLAAIDDAQREFKVALLGQ